MSTEATTSTIPTAEENVEAEQVSEESSNEESVVESKDVEQTTDDETVSSSSAAADNNSDEAVVDTSPQQSNSEDDVATGVANAEDSQKNSDSEGGDSTEHGSTTDGGSGKDMEPDDAKSLKSKAVDVAEIRAVAKSVRFEEDTEAQLIGTAPEVSFEEQPVITFRKIHAEAQPVVATALEDSTEAQPVVATALEDSTAAQPVVDTAQEDCKKAQPVIAAAPDIRSEAQSDTADREIRTEAQPVVAVAAPEGSSEAQPGAAARELRTEAQLVVVASLEDSTEVLPVFASAEDDSHSTAGSSSVGAVRGSITPTSLESGDAGDLSNSLGSPLSASNEYPHETSTAGDSSSRTTLKMGLSNLCNTAVSPVSSDSEDPQEAYSSKRTSLKLNMSRDASKSEASLTSCRTGDSLETAVCSETVGSQSMESSDAGANTRSTSGQDPVVVDHEVHASNPSLPPERLPLHYDHNEPAARNEDRGNWFRRECAAYCSMLKSCSRFIQNSTAYKFFQLLLLGLALRYTYLGIENMGKCPVKKSFPKLVIAVGISFFTSTALSFGLLMFDPVRPQVRRYLYFGLKMARLVFITLLIYVIVEGSAIYPSTGSESKPNCDAIFLNRITYINCFMLAYVLVSCLLCIPFMNGNNDDYIPI